MRIQQGTDYFGNKIVSPVAQPVAPLDNSISSGLQNLSNTFLGIAQNEQRKDQITADKAEKLQLQTIFTEHQSALEDQMKEITEKNADLPADQRYELFRSAGERVKAGTSARLTPEQQAYLEPLHAEALLGAKKSFNNYEEAKLARARTLKENSSVDLAITSYDQNLKLFASEIFLDKSIPEDQKLTEIQTAADQLKENLKQSLGPEHAFLADGVHEKAMFTMVDGLRKQETAKLHDEARANFMSITDSLMQRAATSTKSALDSIRLYDMTDKSMYSEQEQVALRDKFVEDVSLSDISRRKQEASNDMPKLKNLITDLSKQDNGQYSYMPELNPKTRQAYIDGIKNEVLQEQRRIKAEAKAAEAERRNSARDALVFMEDAIKSGMPVSAEDYVRASKLVKGEPMLERRYQQLKDIGTSDIYHQQLINTDPMKYGAAALGYKLEDLNISDPANLAKQIEQRKALGTRIRDANGLKFIPVLKQDEVKMLKGMLDSNAAAGTGMLENIRKMVGVDAMMGIAAQMKAEDKASGSSNAVVIAYVAQGQPEIAKAIADGKRYLKDKAVLLPPDNEMRAGFDKLMGKGLIGLPETQNEYYKSYTAYYAYLAAQNGKMSKDSIDESLSRTAFNVVAGNTARYSGKEVLLPAGYDEDRFRNALRELKETDIQEAGGVYGIADDHAIGWIKEGRWFATERPGVYQVEINGAFLMRKDGKGYLEITLPDPAGVPTTTKAQRLWRGITRENDPGLEAARKAGYN